MSSDLGTKIPLEVFQRHFLVTHLKNKAAGVLDELEQRALQSGEPFDNLLAAELVASSYSQGGYRDDNWYVREVPLDGCYFAQTDFRGHPVPKNERFVDFMPTQRQEIESGSFPYASDIRAPWSGPWPEPMAQERDTGKYYILDGQLRVIRHWYHNVLNVRVFIYRGQCDV